MKLLSEKLFDLHALYVQQLRLLLSAEEMIAIKIPFLIERARDQELAQILREGQEATEGVDARLRDMLRRHADETSPLKCKVVYALFEEAEDMVKLAGDHRVCDAVVIAAAQRVMHYQIAVFATLRQFARVLGHNEDAQILEQRLLKHQETDRRLTQIAERIDPSAKKAA